VLWVLVAALSIHVLAAVFWAGTTFAVARTGGSGAARLFGPQMASAVVAVLTGGYLWSRTHAGAAGRAEHVLGIAAGCALIALAIQGLIGGRSLSALRRHVIDETVATPRIAIAYRAAAGLLAVAAVGMAAARYV